MGPWGTDAKSTVPLGVPTYGFSPLRLDPDERYLERYHGVDERVALDALRWGLPVLYDVVRRFCG
jgi:acetylornithine deacetylase/succinyl-diaminopimelate desuccinylase-like protein